jgi:hypothetical protein
MDQGPSGEPPTPGAGTPSDATASPTPSPVDIRTRRRRLLIGIGTFVAVVALVAGIVVGGVTGGGGNTAATSTTSAPKTSTSRPSSTTSSTTTSAPSTTTSSTTSTTTSSTTTTTVDKQKPSIKHVSVDPSVVYEDGPACGARPTDASISVNVTDNTGVDSVQVSWPTGTATLHAAGPSNGLWIGTVGPFPVGTVPVGGSKTVSLDVTAKDAAGNTATAHGSVTVTASSLC